VITRLAITLLVLTPLNLSARVEGATSFGENGIAVFAVSCESYWRWWQNRFWECVRSDEAVDRTVRISG
jgi:hypothetical protein